MDLPIELKRELADRIIRTVIPVVFFGMIVCVIGLFWIGGNQYHRLVPTVLTIIFLIPPWILAKKGRKYASVVFLVICICLSLIAGIVLSGGIHSISYTAFPVLITLWL